MMARHYCTIRSVHSAHRLLDPLYRNINFCVQHFNQSAVLRNWDDICEFQSFQSDHCSGTIRDVTKKIKERIGVDPGFHTIPKCRSNLLKYQPKREDLPTRTMKDSFTTALLPLSLIPTRERYVNHLGRVRVGRLMEEMDMFAVWICHRHVYVPTLPEGIPLPYVFVTLLVDKVDFLNIQTVRSHEDIDFCGHVSWTGTSSLEITIYIRQNNRTITKSIMMMVARNATNTGPAPINTLKPANKDEQKCYDEAVKRQKRRRRKQSQSVLNVRPSRNDEKLMYDLFKLTKGTDIMDTGVSRGELPANSCWMSDSFQTTTLHPFPDNRNAHNNIFGGYVMRNALEISFIAASLYASGRPYIECMLDVAFISPVHLNSFLKITAYVVYTYEKYMQLLTIVQVMDDKSMAQVTTNAFNLTYAVERKVKTVLPSTYQETLWYISGRNKFQDFQNMRKRRRAKQLYRERRKMKTVDK